MKASYIPINKENIIKQPERFSINLHGITLVFEICWNPEGGFFSVDIYNEEEDPIVLGRKIVYGSDILYNIYSLLELPDVEIIPLDKSGEAEKTGITLDNFGEEVKLYVVGGG
jgi:hypothetical protein